MSRMLWWAFAIGLVLLGLALFVAVALPSSAMVVPLVAAAAVVFFGIVAAIFAMAWRTKGWSLRHPGGGPRTL